MKLFKKLEAARILRGDTMPQAAATIGVALCTLYTWRNGRTAKPRGLYQKAIEDYIRGAGKNTT